MDPPHCPETDKSSLAYYYEKDAFNFQELIPKTFSPLFVFRRAGDPACRLGKEYGSLHIQSMAKETVVKSSLGLGGFPRIKSGVAMTGAMNPIINNQLTIDY
jgi:hypothetical protein